MQQHKIENNYYIQIPTFENNIWTTTVFNTRDEYKEFVNSIFIDAGPDKGYGFDEMSFEFNSEARKFQKQGYYTNVPFRSKDYVLYWDDQKNKCKNGVIFKNKGKTWYLTRDYYMWLNFLPIYDKEEKRFDFAKVRDAQYHMALYEWKAELNYKHCPILKKRQIASSYFHMGKLINAYWFEEGSVNKIGASLKDYISEKGSWRMLNEYRNFLNEHTAWYRPSEPDKIFSWQQRIKVRIGGRDTYKGNKSIITGTSFEKDPTNGVGGPCHTKDTLICMSDGSLKKIQEIKINDLVCGFDGYPKKVLKLFNGSSDIYRVEQSKGITYNVTGEHKLLLWEKNKNDYRIIKTEEFNNLSKDRKRFLKGIKFKGLIGEEKNLSIDPYYLGLYLGDGCKYDFTILVNKTKDIEIWEWLEKKSLELNIPLCKKNKNLYRTDYNDSMWEGHFGTRNLTKRERDDSYKTKMLELGLKNKHIPDVYFQSSKQQRLNLLAGILDTDGYLNHKKNRFEITLHNEQLANDLQHLCILTGFDAHKHIVESDNIKSTVVNSITKGWRINITGNITDIPTKIKRKQALKNGIKNKNRYSNITVTLNGIDEYFGFECEDNLYVLEDGTTTHNCTYFFHEEAGIAPKMMDTYEFMRPALQSGMVTTGTFIAAGSVGDLDQCIPLKEMILYPHKFSMQAVTTDLLDGNKTIGETGLFIPEQWSMPPYIDVFGNSLVNEALEAIYEERKQWKKDLSPEQYQLRISQKPTNIEEAFATRKESIFPPHLISHQLKRIEDGEYPVEYVTLSIGEDNGKIIATKTNKSPIKKFPIDKTMEDKSGVICVYSRPIPNVPWGTYYASIDPVGEGRTTTSDSLCSIFIYKNPTEVIKDDGQGKVSTHFERDEMVASWCGRFDDLQKTHERLEMMIEWYNAWTLVENNVSLFIQYMISKRKQRYLVPKDQIPFLKELSSNASVYATYGWKNTGTLFKTHLISYGIQFLQEELDIQTNESGEVMKTHYGVERIPDPMLLEEMKQYQPGLNVDRLVSFCALVAFAQIQQNNRGRATRVEITSDKLENSQKLSKLSIRSPFRHMGLNSGSLSKSALNSPPRNTFKNIK